MTSTDWTPPLAVKITPQFAALIPLLMAAEGDRDEGLKRLCSCLAMAIEQAQKPKTASPKPTRKPEQKDSN